MLNRRKRLIVLLLPLATSMLACGVSVSFVGETPSLATAVLPTQPPGYTPTVPSWPLVLTEDFAESDTFWSWVQLAPLVRLDHTIDRPWSVTKRGARGETALGWKTKPPGGLEPPGG
jgi:hypothetical protein